MKFLLVDRPEKHGYDLYALTETPAGRIPYRIAGQRLALDVDRAARDGDELPLLLFLDRFQADALREALGSPATPLADALGDARTVRDRLLSMVEREWNAKVMDGE